MPNEDIADIPAEWRDVVHPRRHGMIAVEPARDSGEDAGRERVLDHPLTDSELAVLTRPDNEKLAVDWVRQAFAPDPAFEWPSLSSSLQRIDELVAGRGLARTVAAFVANCEDDLWEEAARHLRSMLAVAPQEVHDEAVAALTLLRDGGSPRQRIVASYLVPDRHDWVGADLADRLADSPRPGHLLFYSAATAEQLSRFTAEQLYWLGDEDRLDQFVTAYDAIGNAAAPLIAQWLAQEWWSPEIRRGALEVLTRIPTDEAFGLLLHLVVELPDVAGGVLAAADRFPRRAARMLASHRDGDLIDVLFLRHVRAHPDVPEAALVRRIPDAPADAVPRLLTSPPWTRKPPPRVTVSPSPLAAEPRIVWQDGEQEEWAYDWWSPHRWEEMLMHLPLAETGEAPAGFYISAPADIVRPHLATWKAESSRFYFEDPEVIVAKYELDALTPMLRLARGKPVVGAALLMPYLAQEVADLMAEWLTRSRQFRPVAQEWFARHGARGAALLIPAALGGPPHDRDVPARRALRGVAGDRGPVRSRQPLRFRLVALPAMGGRGPLVRGWPSQGAAPRAKRGADVLAVMGSDRALGHLSAIARNAKSTPLRTHAAAALDRAAADRGLLPEQLDDLLAPDLGLDGDPVEYRGVSYLVELGAAGGLMLTDLSGQELATLPKPAGADEKAVASAWNSRRRQAKPLIADQTARLEEAMIVQRRWAPGDFQSRIAAHPLLGRVARRLVWVLDGCTVRLDGLGDLIDLAGAPAGGGEWVRLAHPAIDDFAPWRPWLARQGAPQPFVQAGREVFASEDPSAWWQRTVEAAALYRLVRHGWHWGPAGRQALRGELFRPFGAEGRVVLTIDPGVSAVLDAKAEPEQTITELTFESSAGDLGVFSDLPLVTRSELIRSLRALG